MHHRVRMHAMDVNLSAAWAAFLAGSVAGAFPGLFFHREHWMGGYSSWRRRMMRLAHISFFGIGGLNLAFVLTIRLLEIDAGIRLPGILLLVGLIAMPTVCYLSAWRQVFRHLFFIPASSVILALALFLWRIL